MIVFHVKIFLIIESRPSEIFYLDIYYETETVSGGSATLETATVNT